MTLHPRLQPPTLEVAPRRGHSFFLALALTVFAAGFAYAMPRTMLTTAEGDTGGVELTPTGSTHTETATTPTPDPTSTDAEDVGDVEDGTERAENHGAAVSTAAHCDLHGRAHGEFVRSIAHDKDATVAEVEAACAAAMAEAAAGSSEDTRNAGRGHGKAPKAPKTSKTKPHADAAGSATAGSAGGSKKPSPEAAPEDDGPGDTGSKTESSETPPVDDASGDDSVVDNDVDHGSSGHAKGPKPKA